ncbi:hypothetical protein H9P43_002851 [Blastocladiella emersonii ATCC 22665]|nr:hypothetical protein H9P43_002851 [Blastocladiella emersonii ATCC 22665]
MGGKKKSANRNSRRASTLRRDRPQSLTGPASSPAAGAPAAEVGEATASGGPRSPKQRNSSSRNETPVETSTDTPPAYEPAPEQKEKETLSPETAAQQHLPVPAVSLPSTSATAASSTSSDPVDRAAAPAEPPQPSPAPEPTPTPSHARTASAAKPVFPTGPNMIRLYLPSSLATNKLQTSIELMLQPNAGTGSMPTFTLRAVPKTSMPMDAPHVLVDYVSATKLLTMRKEMLVTDAATAEAKRAAAAASAAASAAPHERASTTDSANGSDVDEDESSATDRQSQATCPFDLTDKDEEHVWLMEFAPSDSEEDLAATLGTEAEVVGDDRIAEVSDEEAMEIDARFHEAHPDALSPVAEAIVDDEDEEDEVVAPAEPSAPEAEPASAPAPAAVDVSASSEPAAPAPELEATPAPGPVQEETAAEIPITEPAVEVAVLETLAAEPVVDAPTPVVESAVEAAVSDIPTSLAEIPATEPEPVTQETAVIESPVSSGAELDATSPILSPPLVVDTQAPAVDSTPIPIAETPAAATTEDAPAVHDLVPISREPAAAAILPEDVKPVIAEVHASLSPQSSLSRMTVHEVDSPRVPVITIPRGDDAAALWAAAAESAEVTPVTPVSPVTPAVDHLEYDAVVEDEQVQVQHAFREPEPEPEPTHESEPMRYLPPSAASPSMQRFVYELPPPPPPAVATTLVNASSPNLGPLTSTTLERAQAEFAAGGSLHQLQGARSLPNLRDGSPVLSSTQTLGRSSPLAHDGHGEARAKKPSLFRRLSMSFDNLGGGRKDKDKGKGRAPLSPLAAEPVVAVNSAADSAYGADTATMGRKKAGLFGSLFRKKDKHGEGEGEGPRPDKAAKKAAKQARKDERKRQKQAAAAAARQ